MKIPSKLRAAAIAGDLAVLFGPGAALTQTAEDTDRGVPSRRQLRDGLSDEFFAGERGGDPYEELLDACIKSRGLPAVRAFFDRQYHFVIPNPIARALPKWQWRSLVTCGPDSAIEQSYLMDGKPLQTIRGATAFSAAPSQGDATPLLRLLDDTDAKGIPLSLSRALPTAALWTSKPATSALKDILQSGPTLFSGWDLAESALLDLIERNVGPQCWSIGISQPSSKVLSHLGGTFADFIDALYQAQARSA